jgi:alkylhydroperoxidase family enzyme
VSAGPPERARVKPLSVEEARAAAREVGVPDQMAELEVFRVLLRHPPLAKALTDLLVTLLFRGELDARLRELVIMRIGWVTRSVYEWTQHWRVAIGLEIAEADLLAVRDWRTSDRFGAPERAVLAATDETLEQGTISPETFAECERALGGTEALLELVAAIGNWRLFSSLLRSLDIPLEAGVAPWPPDGRAP